MLTKRSASLALKLADKLPALAGGNIVTPRTAKILVEGLAAYLKAKVMPGPENNSYVLMMPRAWIHVRKDMLSRLRESGTPSRSGANLLYGWTTRDGNYHFMTEIDTSARSGTRMIVYSPRSDGPSSLDQQFIGYWSEKLGIDFDERGEIKIVCAGMNSLRLTAARLIAAIDGADLVGLTGKFAKDPFNSKYVVVSDSEKHPTMQLSLIAESVPNKANMYAIKIQLRGVI
jgi:hypothetical protein